MKKLTKTVRCNFNARPNCSMRFLNADHHHDRSPTLIYEEEVEEEGNYVIDPAIYFIRKNIERLKGYISALLDSAHECLGDNIHPY